MTKHWKDAAAGMVAELDGFTADFCVSEQIADITHRLMTGHRESVSVFDLARQHFEARLEALVAVEQRAFSRVVRPKPLDTVIDPIFATICNIEHEFHIGMQARLMARRLLKEHLAEVEANLVDLVEARVEELVFEKTGKRPKFAEGNPRMDISPGHYLPAGHDRAIPAAYGCARHMNLWGSEQRTELELARQALQKSEILLRFGDAHDWETYPDMTVGELVEMVEKKNKA